MFTPSSLSTAQQHASLIHHLGGAACLVPVPASQAGSHLEVGELAQLPVWSTASSLVSARALGRLLTRGGSLGLLLVRDPTSGDHGIGVTIAPFRLVALGSDPLATLPLRRIAEGMHQPRATALEQAIVFAEALDVDAAGRQTFALLRGLLNRATSLLPGRVPAEERHAWTLIQLTRLLFLRFVESEGWLDGNPRFLAEAIDRCLISRRDPTRHLLHPLFFGTLNRPPALRSRYAQRFGIVPFLNGGLFEPHPIERARPMRLPTEFWRDAFAALVDRVEVSLDAEACDGRVTPELLGRVFEGVMDVDERKQEGAFFTPPRLVDAVVREALACHLAHRLRRSEAAVLRALDDPDTELSRALLDVTILDPAVGSGAFLVGALTLLHGPGPRHPARVRHLVTRRLFGVDRHPDAVRLTELRLWLEVLRSMRGRAAHRVPPLPNLDAAVRAGDALLDPLSGHPLAPGSVAALAKRQRALAAASGAAKRTLLNDLQRLEARGIVEALTHREAALERTIAELLSRGRRIDLFGERTRLQRSDGRSLAALRQERAEVRRERRRMTRAQSAAPFALAAAFGPVLARRGGFDMVVGNPPWVRAERLPEPMRRALGARYKWWRSIGGGWRHLPDLSVAFLERSHELLAPSGTLAMLVPAKLATAGYARVCRDALGASATLHRVADLANDERAGFDATTYPLAIVASRRVAAPSHVVRLGLTLDAPGTPQVEWVASDAWLLASPAVQRLASRLSSDHPALGDVVAPQLGVKTGANEAFLDPPEALGPWSLLALRGRDVRAFRCRPHTRLLWPADPRGAPWPKLPPELLQHFAPHQARLRRRADLHDGTWWRLFRTGAATAAHRVAWGDLARRLEATVVADARVIPINSCYVAALPSPSAAESLAAWLNCSWIRALARLRAEPAAGGAARFGARAVGRVPLPRAVLGHPVLAALFHSAADHDITDALDDCTADLLGLDQHDRTLLAPLAAHRR
ncbi:MAG: hypothetical protein ABIZ70_06735 [Gemmatimonadales bacterium]